MAISEVCQFELKEEVDKYKHANPKLSLAECIRKIIEFYAHAGIELKESTAKSKYFRAGKKAVANATAKDTTIRSRSDPHHFNKTNENIEWATWTWNPVTGCKHGCRYCYARDIANRFYKVGFKPTFRRNRLEAPKHTKIYSDASDGERAVFVCSMADLLGDWVPKGWIESVIDAIKSGQDYWRYYILTKNPSRYLEFEWPQSCWLGATADTQARADTAFETFKKLSNGNTRFLSCEPLEEPIQIEPVFDWLIIGGRSKSSGMRANQPQWEWVESLWNQARQFNIPQYWKPNLKVRPTETPAVTKGGDDGKGERGPT